ncbi:sunset domain-containing protein [Rhizobium ruizarguesonis]
MACSIKGNVSIGSRERIYHMPGQEYYDETKISPQHGERWFCTEAEARAAGWRRAIAPVPFLLNWQLPLSSS